MFASLLSLVAPTHPRPPHTARHIHLHPWQMWRNFRSQSPASRPPVLPGPTRALWIHLYEPAPVLSWHIHRGALRGKGPAPSPSQPGRTCPLFFPFSEPAPHPQPSRPQGPLTLPAPPERQRQQPPRPAAYARRRQTARPRAWRMVLARRNMPSRQSRSSCRPSRRAARAGHAGGMRERADEALAGGAG